ncbi:hypothetical protein Tco_1132800 [Tanacetum coccineum]|uniref:Reverse transcriptase domain-containing protein n=1 Tax=Tanacetum coccineum TaxID=301880 RepID=A0ABQ5JCY1_9ASTR
MGLPAERAESDGGGRQRVRSDKIFDLNKLFEGGNLFHPLLYGFTMWNLKVKSDKIEKYVGGLPDMIHGSMMVSKPKTMQDAIEFATELIDKKMYQPLAERQERIKRRKLIKTTTKLQQTTPQEARGFVGHIAYTDGPGEGRSMLELYRYATSASFIHNGQCTVKNQGHYMSDCSELKNQNHGNQAGGTRARGMVHALGGGETNQDLNNMEDDINA